MKPHAITACVLCLTALILMVGCGKKAPPPTADTQPFEAAVNAYLASKSMDMKVAAFKALEVQADTATATCAMQDKSGLYNVTVQWRFTFRRKQQNGWETTNHEPI